MVGKPLSRKLVVLGDGACGKAIFPPRMSQQRLGSAVFENYVEMMQVDDQMVELSLWDTAGQEDFDRLRSLSYADTHIVMVCFSVDSPVSLDNTESKWIHEVNEFCPGVKIILVALKCDLREDPVIKEKLAKRSLHPVTYDEGLSVARAIRASRYLECSAKHNRGVQEAVYEAARVAIGSRPKGGGGGTSGKLRGSGWREGRCVIL
uniref:Rho family protein n=1 Tax=Kwoniella dejecticola CBS 10117 TaxID=1296121 RepID=A0A1A6ABF0_9TREE|nr:rho family protein [Kwoniella dejecticola CBS 10117]OBR87386.1 rho family protein [Kwoniella dejecticola CBS 10117]